MLAPHVSLLLEDGTAQVASGLPRGVRLRGFARDRFSAAPLLRSRTALDSLSVALVTVSGRRLVVGWDQKVLTKGRSRRLWKKAGAVEIGARLVVVEPGTPKRALRAIIVSTEKVSCVVHSHGQPAPWHVLEVPGRTVVAEGVVCRTT